MRKLNRNTKVTCLTCGKDFFVTRWRSKGARYCSPECSWKGKETPKSYNNKRICIICGTEYYPTNWGQRYCSRKCFFKGVTKHIKKKIPCPVCGKEFIQKRKEHNYCSRECGESRRLQGAQYIRKNYLDKKWGQLVKLLANEKCEYCGKKEYLNSHHLFSRSNLKLRWDTDNGVCLCVGHHVFATFSAHKSPIDFIEWIRTKRGDEWYERLRIKSRELATTIDKEAILGDLNNRLKQIEENNAKQKNLDLRPEEGKKSTSR